MDRKYKLVVLRNLFSKFLTLNVLLTILIFFILIIGFVLILDNPIPSSGKTTNAPTDQTDLPTVTTQSSVSITTEIPHEVNNCTQRGRIVTCLEILVKDINKYLSLYQGEIDLRIINGKFFVGSIKPNWINVTNLQINQIYIQNSNLMDIMEHSFNSSAFKTMKMLELKNTKLSYFKQHTFEGLDTLVSLKIYNNDTEKAIQFLEPLKNLNIFEFYDAGSETVNTVNVRNFLKTNFENKITSMVLSGLNIGTDFLLTSNTFNNFTSLKSLKLNNCHIKNITSKTFSPLVKNLEYLDLSRNDLAYIPENIFTKLLQKPNFKINLNENKWFCDCNLVSLTNDINNYPNSFEDIPVCEMPIEFQHEKVNKIVPTVCGHRPTYFDNSSDCGNGTLPVNTRNFLKIKEEDVNIFIQKISSSTVFISFNESLVDYALIWFSNENQKMLNPFESRTLKNKSNKIIVENLKQNTSYSFCLIKISQKMISTHNCQPYFVPAEKSLGSHPQHCKKSIEVFIIIGITIFLSLISGIFVMYLVIRRRRLLENNPQINAINRNLKANVIVLPKNDSNSNVISPPSYENICPIRRHSDPIIGCSQGSTANVYEFTQRDENFLKFNGNNKSFKQTSVGGKTMSRRCSRISEECL